MVAISPRIVFSDDVASGEPQISTESVQVSGLIEAQSFLLGMSSFSAGVLRQLKAYPVSGHVLTNELAEDIDIALTVEERSRLPDVLSSWLAAQQEGGILFDFDGEHQSDKNIVQEFVRLGFAREPHSGNQKHSLTQLGQKAITSAVKVQSPVMACDSTPNRPLKDFNSWELVLELGHKGWQHRWACLVDGKPIGSSFC